MHTTNANILHELTQSAYQRTGEPEPLDNVVATIARAHEAVLPIVQHRNMVSYVANKTLWELGNSGVRYAMAIGSIATGSWPGSYQAKPLHPIHFSWPNELVNAAHDTNDGELAVDSLVAVGEQFVATYDSIPSNFVHWAAAVGSLADGPQQQRVNDILAKVRFSDHHTDSENMDDQHDVARFLGDDSLPLAIRQRLLALALTDARNATYKPHVWQSQMNATLQNLANGMDSPLRFIARHELSLPESDADLQALIDEQAAERVRVNAVRDAERETAATAQNVLIRAAVTRALQA